MNENKVMTASEAGAKGGNSCKAQHGLEHYQRIGKMGGEKVRDERGTEYFRRIGALGGRKKKKHNGQHGETCEYCVKYLRLQELQYCVNYQRLQELHDMEAQLREDDKESVVKRELLDDGPTYDE